MQSIPREMNQEADSRKLSWRNKRRISLSFSSVFVIKIPKYQHKRSRIAKVSTQKKQNRESLSHAKSTFTDCESLFHMKRI